jgi:hypothetical protein
MSPGSLLPTPPITTSISLAAGGCEIESWLVPGACILPTPVEILIPLGQWERTSEKLVVNDRAKAAMR